ncbi:MAG: hypothetical protein JST84_05200 [Acidobacteria bacterium]|nr:hypothetical protein [Acidobacteriota bacterium]
MTPITPVDAEIWEAIKEGYLEGEEAHSLIYRHFMTVEERIALAVDGITLTDIAHGRVPGDTQEKYNPLLRTINQRLGFRYWMSV